MASRRSSALFFLLVLITCLTACGKTGPLYLPDEQAESIDSLRPSINLNTLV